ncbi:MAG: InlB B-repeat-containing protein, partial [Bacillota bacterium]|nr:InlB B-repeat-containing protein [Bacillota bacterium]
MNKQLRKIMALALTVVMLFSLLPLDVLAGIITTDYSGGVSVRAIVPVVPTHTYHFISNGATVSTQIVKNNETLNEPEAPSHPDGFEFLGWFDALEGGNPITFGSIEVQSTQTINAYARFANKYKVSFVYINMQGNTIVLGVKEVSPNAAVNADGISYADKLEARKAFSHWSVASGGSAYNFSTPVTANMTLYLITKDLHKVTFNVQGGTQVLPVFVENNQSISGAGFNPASSKAGYDLDGWLLNGTPYSLTTPVTGDIALTASWTPRTDTPYRVVYWFENAEDTGYSYAAFYDAVGTTDTIATFETPSAGNHYGADFANFTYNAAVSETNKTISGDGTTLVNVYYQRKTYTLRFYNTNDSLISSHVGVKVGASTKPYWDANASYAQPGYVWRDMSDNPPYGITHIEAPLMPARDFSLHLRYDGTSSQVQFIEQDINENVVGTIKVLTGTAGAFYGGRLVVGFTWKRLYGRHPYSYSAPKYSTTYVYPYNGVIKTFYQRNIYILSFNTNGGNTPVNNISIPYEGSLEGKAPTSYVVDTTTKTVNNIKYVFKGWYDNEALGGQPFSFTGQMPANNIILYAKWEVQTINLTWYPTWTGGTPTTVTINHGQSLLDAGHLPQADLPLGMTQDDVTWYRRDGNVNTIFPLNTPVMETGVVLYPKLPGGGYSVTYNSNGGGEAPVDGNIYTPNSYAIAKDAPTPPANLVFIGWKDNDSGTIYYPGERILMTADVTLTAQWGPVPQPAKITYYANGGSGGPKEISLPNNSTHAVLTPADAGISRPGYTFVGWNTVNNGTGLMLQPGQDVIIDNTSANELYAMWGAITVEKTLSSINNNTALTKYSAVGDVLKYTVTVTNTGNVQLTNVVVTDTKTGLSETVAVLAAGETKTFTTAHTVTQADLDAGSYVNTASAKSDEITTPVEDTE